MVLGLMPRVGEEDPELAHGFRGERYVEDFGCVGLDRAHVLEFEFFDPLHELGQPRRVDLDGEEVGLGIVVCRVRDGFAEPSSDFDDEWAFGVREVGRDVDVRIRVD